MGSRPPESRGTMDRSDESDRIRRIEADAIFHDGRFHFGSALIVGPGGRIRAVGPGERLPATRRVRRYPGLIVPGAVNAHSHAFQVLLRGSGDAAVDFRDWVDHHMYPLALALDGDGIELASELAFAEMVKNGVTTVGEFFYLHNAPESEDCRPLGNRNAHRVVAAARRVGLRIHLLRCLYDRRDKPAQRRFYEPAAGAVDATIELEEATADDPATTVGIAPHSLHGATGEGIQAAAEYAAERDRPFQIHLAEEEHDIDYARERYGTTPGRALERLGVVSERTCIVHGCWLDPEEIDRLGEAGAKCAYNPISNMALGDGITDVPRMIRAGVTVGLGCDGPGANHQVNVWQEMRFAEWLQRVRRLRMNVLPTAATEAGRARSVNYCFEMGTRNGGTVLGLPVGSLQPGQWADFAVLDRGDLSLLPDPEDDPDALLHNVVHSMAPRGSVSHVVVGGEEILADGRLVRIDEAELGRRVTSWRHPGRT